jgi:hypothetical protein
VKLRRRDFLERAAQAVALGGAAMAAVGSGCRGIDRAAGQPFFLTRGVVLVPGDLTLEDWPARAKKAGLTTIALHHGSSPKVVSDFIVSEEGQSFLAASSRLG